MGWNYDVGMNCFVSIATLLAANDEVNGVLIRYDRFVKNSASSREGVGVGVAITEPTPPTQQAETVIGLEVSGEEGTLLSHHLMVCACGGGMYACFVPAFLHVHALGWATPPHTHLSPLSTLQPPPTYSALNETTAADEPLLIDLGDEMTAPPSAQIAELEQELASVGQCVPRVCSLCAVHINVCLCVCVCMYCYMWLQGCVCMVYVELLYSKRMMWCVCEVLSCCFFCMQVCRQKSLPQQPLPRPKLATMMMQSLTCLLRPVKWCTQYTGERTCPLK